MESKNSLEDLYTYRKELTDQIEKLEQSSIPCPSIPFSPRSPKTTKTLLILEMRYDYHSNKCKNFTELDSYRDQLIEAGFSGSIWLKFDVSDENVYISGKVPEDEYRRLMDEYSLVQAKYKVDDANYSLMLKEYKEFQKQIKSLQEELLSVDKMLALLVAFYDKQKKSKV